MERKMLHNIKRKLPSIKLNRKQKITLFFSLFLLAAAISVLLYLAPGFTRSNWGEDTVLVIDNVKAGEDLVRLADREILIDVTALQEYIDPGLFWDHEEETAVITTRDRVIHMRSEDLTAKVNLQPVELAFPLKVEKDNLFLPLLFLADYYSLDIDYIVKTDTVVIDRMEKPAFLARVSSGSIRLREGPGLRFPYLTILEKGDELRLAQEDNFDRWVAVRSSSGITGYLPRSSFSIQGTYPFPEPPKTSTEPIPLSLPGHPITMTWEFTYPNPDVATIDPMPSLQVVSPTWFHLNDSKGNLRNLADPAYVKWAHERGYLVWALFSNSFDPDITARVLSSSTLRQKVAAQLLAYARLYDLDGLNIDFENFHYNYRDHFTQFIRELAPLCRQEGLVLSVDITMISGEPYWSKGYDRAALAEAADYIILMAYDEHWENGPVPGPVASLPWVERGLQAVLQEVPPGKLILGVPFYTRVWKIDDPAGDNSSISSRSYSMERTRKILADREYEVEWDNHFRQYKTRYTENGNLYKLWLEDVDTMRFRLELVKEYSLAGVAGWRRGLESPEIWELIDRKLSPLR